MNDIKNNAFKNRNILVIVFEILVIALGIIGITFATSKLLNDRTQTLITTGEYNIEYVGDSQISFNEIEPMDDKLVNIDTKDNVVRVEFSLKGASTNKKKNLIYDVMLSEINIDCSLLNEYTKWNLYKNGSLLSTGSLSPSFDGNVLGDNLRLTNIQEDLPKFNEDYDNYVLIFWISESCEDLLTCKLIDQSTIANSKMSMKVFIGLYGGAKKSYQRVPNNDLSCANKPVLASNMIAVNYVNDDLVVADQSNSDQNNLWYDYSNQKWANAVVVSNDKYNTIGMKIDKEDILGYYVWIPRFRYKLWNELGEEFQEKGLDIIFENGLNRIDGKEEDTYLTHPAFGNDLNGFWISKYEISKDQDNYLSIPGVESYRNDSVENYKEIINNLASNYKLGNMATSEMIDDLKWEATLYLSYSKYGVCKDNECFSITGNGSYITGKDINDSTTKNIYGVFDMIGAASEYVNYEDNYLVKPGIENSLSENISTRSVIISK